MILELEDDKGRFEIDPPMSCGEITLNGYHEFKNSLTPLSAKIEDDVELDIDIDSVVIEAVSKLVKGDISRLDYSGGARFEEGGEVTIEGLYIHLVEMIQNYKPNEEFKELRWSVTVKSKKVESTLIVEQPNVMAAYGLDKSYRTYSTGELLTYKEFEKRIAANAAEFGDVDGNFAFSLDCTQMAILLRRKGEPLPVNGRIREQFIQTRSKDFENLPLNVFFDVGFFLKTIVRNFEKTLNYSTFSIAKKGSAVVVRKGKKPLKKRKS